MIASSTGDCVPATGVGAHCVDARLARQAWTGAGHTLIYIDTAAGGILDETLCAPLLWMAAKRAGCVGASKVWSTIMGPQSTLIYVLAVVVIFELIPSATAGFPLTAKGALCVNANLAGDAVVTASQTLINILTVHFILFQLITIMACTCTITNTQLGAVGVSTGVRPLWRLSSNAGLRRFCHWFFIIWLDFLCHVFATAGFSRVRTPSAQQQTLELAARILARHHQTEHAAVTTHLRDFGFPGVSLEEGPLAGPLPSGHLDAVITELVSYCCSTALLLGNPAGVGRGDEGEDCTVLSSQAPIPPILAALLNSGRLNLLPMQNSV